MKPYLGEVNISVQDLALWWTNIVVYLFAIFGLVVAALLIVLYVVEPLDTTDKYNLNPRPVCAPARLNGKTVTNCVKR